MNGNELAPDSGDSGASDLSLQQAVVLAAVVRRPSHGYELVARIDRVCGAFMKVHPPTVYMTLDRLEGQLLVRSEPQRVESKRGVRVVYQATAAGAKAYREWITSNLDADFAQAAVRLAFAAPLGTAAIRTILSHYEQACERELTELDELTSQEHPGNIEWFLAELVRSGRRHRLHAAQEWIAEQQARTSQFEQQQP